MRCPIHEPEMTLALETEVSRGELYSLEWDRVDTERSQLLLLKTKNRTARVVILTTAAVAALEELRGGGARVLLMSASLGMASRWFRPAHGLSLSWRKLSREIPSSVM